MLTSLSQHVEIRTRSDLGIFEGSVRSWVRRRPGRDREHDLIEAGLNEAAVVLALSG